MSDQPEFLDVLVVLRSRGAAERRWRVEVGTRVPLRDLLPELIRELHLGCASDYELAQEGTIAEPVLVLTHRTCPCRVRSITEEG